MVPLRSGQTVIGTLEVVNRLGDASHFRAGDVQVLETIAAHAAVAVENSRLVDRLRYDAYHDRLTGLPNRRRITDALDESVKVRAPGEVVAVLLFDVDGLRDVNESMGHAAGDKLLAEVAEPAARASPARGALVGRIGGDEFVVTLRAESTEATVQLATEMREQLRGPMVGRHAHPRRGHRGRRRRPPRPRRRPGDPAAAGRAGRQRGQGRCRTACSCSTRPWSPGRSAGSASPATCAGRWTPASSRSTSSPRSPWRDRHLVGVECLARWQHPAHGDGRPGGLRRGRRAHRPARPADRGGAHRGAAALPGVGRRGPAAVHRGQPVRPYAARLRASRTRCRSCSSEYRRRAAAR